MCWRRGNSYKGRDEERIVYAAPPPAELQEHPEWIDVRSVVMIYRATQRGGQLYEEIAFYLSSLSPQAKKISRDGPGLAPKCRCA